MFMSLQSQYIEILTPRVMVWRDKAFERWLSHGGRDLGIGIVHYIGEPRTDPNPSLHISLEWEDGCLWGKGHPHLQNCENCFSWLWVTQGMVFVVAAHTDQDTHICTKFCGMILPWHKVVGPPQTVLQDFIIWVAHGQVC
jgi:hypothetical protein